ncbi:MAG: DUF2207 domain-containing protein [Oscillospiraceae bacterium]|nr:DUF2207 domain-containing protein [Oscillospiraceae bacterium]
MKRAFRLIGALVLCCCLAVSVSALSVTQMESHSSVAADGGCQVSINAAIHLDSAVDKLTFPIPAKATGVTLNGSRVSATKDGDVRHINLRRITGGMPGDYSVHIAYSLDDVIVTTEEGLLEMQVPLLSGCEYPVDALTFSVTLPGPVNTLPTFISGYHQASIEQSLVFQTEGAMVSGSSLKQMKDHETLMLHLVVSEEMFPQSIVKGEDYTIPATAMIICGALALVYWLITMWTFPTRREDITQPPQGSSAGNLGSIIGLQGIDLPMLVFSWAQLGYILIHLDRRSKVVLHKRMDMGNERSEWERRIFNKLFGKRQMVDTSGYGFATLWQQAGKKTGGVQEMVARFNGSKKVFRVLSAGIGLFGGACLGFVMGSGAFLKWILIVLLAVVGALAAWRILDWAAGAFLRYRRKLWTALILGGVWLIFGLISGEFMLTLWTVLALFVAGFLLFWGGRRTPLGKTNRQQVLDLKRYMLKLSKADAENLSVEDPDYFFRLAPEALALGVDREYAKKFGALRYPGCPYLTIGMDGQMTAQQWNAMMRRALEAMDDRGQSLGSEKFLGMIRSLIKG